MSASTSLSQTAARPRGARVARRLGSAALGAAFVGPAFCYILLIVIYPLCYALWASLTNLRLTSPVSAFGGLRTYAAALDNFKILLGMPVEDELEVVPVQLDVNVPELDADAPELAMRYRLDLQTQRDRIEDAQKVRGLMSQVDPGPAQ